MHFGLTVNVADEPSLVLGLNHYLLINDTPCQLYSKYIKRHKCNTLLQGLRKDKLTPIVPLGHTKMRTVPLEAVELAIHNRTLTVAHLEEHTHSYRNQPS